MVTKRKRNAKPKKKLTVRKRKPAKKARRKTPEVTIPVVPVAPAALHNLTPIKGFGGWQSVFLATLEVCGIVSWAAKEAGISRVTAYDHRKADEAFAAAWKEAIEVAVEGMEAEARRRAVEGVLKPVYQGGVKVGEVLEYSDTLLIFLLKAAKPWKYRDNPKVVVSGDPDNPVKHLHAGTVTARIEQLAAAFAGAADREADGEPRSEGSEPAGTSASTDVSEANSNGSKS